MRPERSAVSCGVLWTFGSETIPEAKERAVSLGSGVTPPNTLLLRLALLGPSALGIPRLPRGEGWDGLVQEGRRGASANQPRVKDFADPWGDS